MPYTKISWTVSSVATRYLCTNLEQVWQNTTAPSGNWDGPLIERFFRTVATQMRCCLPSGGYECCSVSRRSTGTRSIVRLTTSRSFGPWVFAMLTSPDVIRREILGKGRRALIAYGALHFQRKNVYANYGSEWPEADTLVMQLEAPAPRQGFHDLEGDSFDEGAAVLYHLAACRASRC